MRLMIYPGKTLRHSFGSLKIGVNIRNFVSALVPGVPLSKQPTTNHVLALSPSRAIKQSC